jgi:ferrochelatase
MAHGTPSSLDEMPEYLRLVRGGRPPSDELIAEMRHNYQAIGGRSPLTGITLAQAEQLRARLGKEIPVAVGMRNWTPFIREALLELASAGVTRVIAIPLAPQYSTLSAKKYIDTARAALTDGIRDGITNRKPDGMQLDPVESYHAHPLLIEAFAERVRAAQPRHDELVVFTAHALPRRAVAEGDRYVDEVDATARGVAERSGVARYVRAFQSAGRTPEPWTGPDIRELLDEQSIKGVRRFLVVPIGFVCDHTEILFDIDVQAARAARELAAALRRTESLNTSPVFISLIEELVRSKM